MFTKLFKPTTLLAGTAVLASYPAFIRPWHTHWGALRHEVYQSQPGDEIIPNPDTTTTRAITVEASKTAVWPWLLQIGQGRGGYYSYDWLENLAGLNIHSADEIMPEFQQLKVGDILPNSRSKPNEGVVVARLEPERALVLHGTLIPGRAMKNYPIHIKPDTPSWADWTWSFILNPVTPFRTRLITRFRIAYEGWWPPLLVNLLIDPLHFVMERKMLLGIKERAERPLSRPKQEVYDDY